MYTRIGTNAVYKPVTAGSEASMAYARPGRQHTSKLSMKTLKTCKYTVISLAIISLPWATSTEIQNVHNIRKEKSHQQLFSI